MFKTLSVIIIYLLIIMGSITIMLDIMLNNVDISSILVACMIIMNKLILNDLE